MHKTPNEAFGAGKLQGIKMTGSTVLIAEAGAGAGSLALQSI